MTTTQQAIGRSRKVPKGGITEPGHYDLDEAAYHADPVVGGSLSATGAKTLATRTAAHFRHQQQHGRPDKKEFDLGHGAHMVVTGSGAPIMDVAADDWRTKAAKEAAHAAREMGQIPLLSKDVERVEAMADALRQHPIAGPLLMRRGRAEQSFVARDPESGVMCRVRFDWMPTVAPGERVIGVDYKTTTDASPGAFAAAVARFHYDQQDPFYIDALHWLGLTAGPDGELVEPLFVFVAQEKDPPYLVSVDRIKPEDRDRGRWLNRYARDLYRQCSEAGRWPGYEDPDHPAVHDLELPGWHTRQLDAAIEAGRYDTASDLTTEDA